MQDKHKPKIHVVSNLSIPLCILTLLWLGLSMVSCSVISPSSIGKDVVGGSNGIGSSRAYAEEGDGQDTPISRASANTTVNNYSYVDSTVGIGFLPMSGVVELTPTSQDGVATKINTTASIVIENSDNYDVYVGSNTPNLAGSSSTNTVEIPSISTYTTFAELPTNTWGFAYAEGSNIANDALYAPIPTGKGLRVMGSNGSSDIERVEKDLTLSFAARINNEVPADRYTSTVTVSVVSSPRKVATFGGITTMQALTPQVCKEADENDTAYLEDIRDRVGGAEGTGTHYWVAKLADGNCWMSQNLDLNLDVDKPLTVAGGSASEYTPVVSTFGPNYPDKYSKVYDNSTKAYYSWDEGKYVVIYPSPAQDIWKGFTQEQGGIEGFTDHNKVLALGYDGLQNTKYGVVMDVSGSDGINWRPSTDPNFTNATQYEQDGVIYKKNAGWAISFASYTYDAHYLIGNYYQWLAATAQTEADGKTAPTDGTPVATSICPAGWQLPSSGTMNNDRRDSFYNLLKHYGNLVSATAGSNVGVTLPGGAGAMMNIANGSLFFQRAGTIDPPDQIIRDLGSYGLYWSVSAASKVSAITLRFNASDVYPTYNNSRQYGCNVRCLVISPEND